MSKVKTEQYGIFIYLGTLFFFAAMEAQAKYLSESFSVLQIVWARYTFHFVVIAIALLILKIFSYKVIIKKPNLLRVQILRSVALLLMTYFFFASLSKLPLAEATIILFIDPLITIILSPWLLKEKVNLSSWIAVLLGILGMLIVVNPNYILFQPTVDKDWIIGIFYGILGALFYSLYKIATRVLAPKESTVTSLLFAGAAGVILTSIFMLINFDPISGTESWESPRINGWILLISVGCFGAIGQLVILWAYAKSKATTLAPISYCHIIWAVLFGFLIFNSLPNVQTVLGALLIVFSGIYAYKKVEKHH